MTVRWPRRTIVPKMSAELRAQDEGAPSVSVIIPTYNRAPLLPRAVQSVLAQSFTNFELIVVDDGSTEQTTDVVNRFSDPRVRIIRLTMNGGVSHALNRGVLAARGEFVSFLGDDDEWLPDLLRRLVPLLCADSTCSLAYGGATWRTRSGRTTEAGTADLPDGGILDQLLAGSSQVCASACLARRDVLLRFGGFDETMRRGEDTDLWLRMSAAGHQVAAVRESLAIVHREHGLNQLTRDPVLAAVALQQFHRRWHRLACSRLGADSYNERRERRSKRLHRDHRKVVKGLIRAGDRREAWRYAVRMRPALPWSTTYVTRAVAIALFGRWPYRVRRAARRLSRLLNVNAANRAGDDQPLDL